MAAKKKMTEVEWNRVFRFRCKAKRGESLTDEERDFVERAWREDKKRYGEMEPDIFDATVPFGSSARSRR